MLNQAHMCPQQSMSIDEARPKSIRNCGYVLQTTCARNWHCSIIHDVHTGLHTMSSYYEAPLPTSRPRHTANHRSLAVCAKRGKSPCVPGLGDQACAPCSVPGLAARPAETLSTYCAELQQCRNRLFALCARLAHESLPMVSLVPSHSGTCRSQGGTGVRHANDSKDARTQKDFWPIEKTVGRCTDSCATGRHSGTAATGIDQ